MRLILAVMAALSLAGAAHAGADVRLIASVTKPGFDPRASVQVNARTPEQRASLAYNVMASRLGEALVKAGLNVQQTAAEPDVYVLFDYKAVAIPPFRIFGSTTDPAYRAVVVTAIEARPWRESQEVKIVWQTAFDQTGLSTDETKTIPRMLQAGERWYGRNLTKPGLGPAANCAGQLSTSVGSHLGYCGRTLAPAAAIAAGLGAASGY